MANLFLLLMGTRFLRERWRTLLAIGLVWMIAGVVLIVDALDNALYFPIYLFAGLFLIDGLAALALVGFGVGAQRTLRLVRGGAAVLAALLILSGEHHGNFVLSMIFGTLFLLDGLLQCVSAHTVRFPRWRLAFGWGVAEIAIAGFFYQPYPTHYVGTLPYALGLMLVFGGLNLLNLALRVRRLNDTVPVRNVDSLLQDGQAVASTEAPRFARSEWDGPPDTDERALTVHVWTPTGSSKAPTQSQPLIDRYIAAVDVNGVISTGHAALESPEGIYISLYPGVEIDRSPGEFGRLLKATPENDIAGVFQPDYVTESKAWCPSTFRVRIRNYDAAKLDAFWQRYRREERYNLTHRNCSSSVSAALEAAVDGAWDRLHGKALGWMAFLRILSTPELWVAAQIRKRAVTMAWTPGLTLDYARALSMLVDPRPFAWRSVARSIRLSRRSPEAQHDPELR
ncbi:MAG: DUF308 domain-containing protein [Burkholderiaceae bacterium]